MTSSATSSSTLFPLSKIESEATTGPSDNGES
jgi:hypothetical protein